jgi:hypothetical protein
MRYPDSPYLHFTIFPDRENLRDVLEDPQWKNLMLPVKAVREAPAGFDRAQSPKPAKKPKQIA